MNQTNVLTKSKFKAKEMNKDEAMKIVRQIMKDYKHTLRFLEKL